MSRWGLPHRRFSVSEGSGNQHQLGFLHPVPNRSHCCKGLGDLVRHLHRSHGERVCLKLLHIGGSKGLDSYGQRPLMLSKSGDPSIRRLVERALRLKIPRDAFPQFLQPVRLLLCDLLRCEIGERQLRFVPKVAACSC